MSANVHRRHPLASLIPDGARVLWVASAGGHYAQLMRIANAATASQESQWVTFDTPQTRGTDYFQQPNFVPYIAPRDWRAGVRALKWSVPFLRKRRFDICVSTGAGLALAVLPVALLRGIKVIYIESISRVDGPSMSGRILARIPHIDTYTQHQKWSSPKWKWRGSILDSWALLPAPDRLEPRKIFVTLGTIRPYGFDRAVQAVLSIMNPDDEVVWQLGSTRDPGLPGTVHAEVSQQDFQEFAEWADVTVTHAGVGSLMQLLDLGIRPVLVVRSSVHGEHVDDHQSQIASEMSKRELALVLDLDRPDRDSLTAAAQSSVRSADGSSSRGSSSRTGTDGN